MAFPTKLADWAAGRHHHRDRCDGDDWFVRDHSIFPLPVAPGEEIQLATARTAIQE
jgi:hypothetical protein